MKLEAAKSALTAALGRMNALYNHTVFDEWVVISLQPDRGAIVAYFGPRGESFRRQFPDDIMPLRAEVAERHLAVGDFAFAQDAAGTHFDACIRVGESCFLLCNHTGKTMGEIRRSPRWLEAQKAFAELSEKFRADPLE